LSTYAPTLRDALDLFALASEAHARATEAAALAVRLHEALRRADPMEADAFAEAVERVAGVLRREAP
jgi:N-acetylglucosamine kinase-like BadF-type ATPase